MKLDNIHATPLKVIQLLIMHLVTQQFLIFAQNFKYKDQLIVRFIYHNFANLILQANRF